jgi:arginyl-tRNA synthetase
MDPLSSLKMELAGRISGALSKEGVEVDPASIEISERNRKSFGDLSSPIVIKEASSRGLDPAALAESVAAEIAKPPMIERTEALRGYINFFVDWDRFGPHVIGNILGRGSDYGRPEGKRGALVLEHTSVNPTGPLNIARSRNSIIGDALARTFSHLGWDVRRHYLLNDIGHQAVVIYWGVEQGIRSGELEEQYSAYAHKPDFRTFFTYVPASARLREDPEARSRVAALESMTHSNGEVLEGLRRISRECLEGQLDSLSRLGIGFDEIRAESSFLDVLPDVLDRLRDKGVIVEGRDLSVGLDLSHIGLSRRKTDHLTLVKSDGSSTYTLRDIAYHEWKFREGDLFITVLGEDHKREFAELSAILRLLGHRKDIRAAFYSFVTYEGGKKMSTRAGKTVPLDEIMDDAISRSREEVLERRGELPEETMASIARDVGLGAIKFNILKVDPGKGISFRWEEAINFAGDSSAYVQYACARAYSILSKAGQEIGEGDISLLSMEEERDLIWSLARTPGVIERSAEEMKPNLLAEEALEVATLFTRFYMQHRVLQAEEPVRTARLALVSSARTVLSLLLDLLGIAAPKEI